MLRLVSLELEMVNQFKKVANESGVRLTVADCRDFDLKGMSMLMQIEGDHRPMQQAVKGLRKLKGVRHLYDSGVSESKTYCLTVLDRPNLCDASLGTGIVCMQCPYNEGEVNPTWKVLVSKPDDIPKLITRLRRRGVGAIIKSISKVNQEELLTRRQKEILAMAISLGYFDFPRKISLTKLGEKAGIKPSTLSEVLRNAERKILGNTANNIKLPVDGTVQTKEALVNEI